MDARLLPNENGLKRRVGSGTARSRSACLRWIRQLPLGRSAGPHSDSRIGMIEILKVFHAELSLIRSPNLKGLADREIDITKTGITEKFPAHSAKLPPHWDQNRIPTM